MPSLSHYIAGQKRNTSIVCWLIILPEVKMKYRWLLLITSVLMADAYAEIDATAFKLKRISDGDT